MLGKLLNNSRVSLRGTALVREDMRTSYRYYLLLGKADDNMKSFTTAVLLLLLVALSSSSADDTTLACKSRPDLAGACRIVHGRLMFYNGTPSFRIWIIGTQRLLGVHEVHYGDNPERPLMPDSIWKQTGGDELELYGDFEVCPLSKERKGWMQMVCIESANNVVTRPYDGPRYNDQLR